MELFAGLCTWRLVQCLGKGMLLGIVDQHGSRRRVELLVPFPGGELDPHLWYLLSTLPSSSSHLCKLSCPRTFRMVSGRLLKLNLRLDEDDITK